MVWKDWKVALSFYQGREIGARDGIELYLSDGYDLFSDVVDPFNTLTLAQKKSAISSANTFWQINEANMRHAYTQWTAALTGTPRTAINVGGIFRAVWWVKPFDQQRMEMLAPTFGTPPEPSRENGYRPMLITPVDKYDANPGVDVIAEIINSTAGLSYPPFSGFAGLTTDYDFETWFRGPNGDDGAYVDYLEWAGHWQDIANGIMHESPWSINGGPSRQPFDIIGTWLMFTDPRPLL